MRRVGIVTALSIAVIVLSASAALAAVAPGTYTTPGINTANGPSGAHLQTGTISCTVASDLSISCTSYELAGVGHTNANVLLTAQYTAIVDCFNPGTNPNNPIESHQTTFSPSSQVTVTSSKNGRLAVPTRSVSFSGAPVGCPNANWTPTVRPGSVTLVSFSYTLTFDGFSAPFITIARP